MNLAEWLRGTEAGELRDIAFTLAMGRRAFAQRCVVVARHRSEAAEAFAAEGGAQLLSGMHEEGTRGVAFLFPGQGSQYVDMGRELYRTEPVFRAELDRCCDGLMSHLERDLREVIFPRVPGEEAELELARTELAQPALFAIEYATARLWRAWGIEPQAMIGHSIGEFVAAHLAGVLTLEEALALVAARGRLMQSLETGAMLAVALPEEDLAPLLGAAVSLAAVNGPSASVVSGPVQAILALAGELGSRGIPCRRLHTSHAFHSAMTEPILEAWKAEVAAVDLKAPERPYVSNVSGRLITAEEATDPDYWVRHLRGTVRFNDGARTLLEERQDLVLLEIGPGRTLSTLLRQQPAARERPILTSMRHPKDSASDREHLLTTLGRLWLNGVEVDWPEIWAEPAPRRVHLPTYPFQRQRYWVGESEYPATGEVAPERDAGRPSASHVRPALGTPYRPPETEAEEILCEIWQEILGIREVGVRDDFFELGGSSLMAVTLMARIEERLGVSLATSVLSEATTVESLARRLAATGSDSPLVELQPEGRGPGVFWFHPIGGDVLCYLELVQRLGRERPMYGFKAFGLDGEGEPGTSIEGIAALYEPLLREKQPDGPYLLAGWSFGGLVAYELARRLEAAGEEIALLALIDSWPPAAARPIAETSSQEIDDDVAVLSWFLRDLLMRGLTDLGLSPDELRQLEPQRRFDAVVERAIRSELVPARGGAERLRRLYRVFQAHVGAVSSFRPRPSGSELVLFKASEGPRGRVGQQPVDGGEIWQELLGRPIESHEIPGDHYSILTTPRVDSLADHLKRCLARIEGPAAEGTPERQSLTELETLCTR